MHTYHVSRIIVHSSELGERVGVRLVAVRTNSIQQHVAPQSPLSVTPLLRAPFASINLSNNCGCFGGCLGLMYVLVEAAVKAPCPRLGLR